MNAWIIVGVLFAVIATIGFLFWQVYYRIKIQELREEIQKIHG